MPEAYVAAVGAGTSRGAAIPLSVVAWARRLSIIVLAASVFAVAVVPATAQTDLQRAKDEVEDAESERTGARAEVGVQRAELTEAGRALAAAFEEYSVLAQELSDLSLVVLEVEEGIRRTERDLAATRDLALEQAVEVYTSAVAGTGLFSLLSGADPATAVIAAGVLDDLAQEEQSYLADYSALRNDLERRRAVLEDQQEVLAELTDEADAKRDVLEELYAAAEEELAAAEAAVRRADAAYASALDALAKEERRLASLRGAESWRWLVEIYFPEGLVDEALAIIQCESRGNADAKNPRSTAAGLWQFLEGTWSWASVEAGWGGSSRWDPEASTAVAAWLVQASVETGHRYGRWGHWECRRMIYPKYSDGSVNHSAAPGPAARLTEEDAGA